METRCVSRALTIASFSSARHRCHQVFHWQRFISLSHRWVIKKSSPCTICFGSLIKLNRIRNGRDWVQPLRTGFWDWCPISNGFERNRLVIFFSPISIIHRLVRDGRDEKKIPSVRSGVELEKMGDDKKNVVKKNTKERRKWRSDCQIVRWHSYVLPLER